MYACVSYLHFSFCCLQYMYFCIMHSQHSYAVCIHSIFHRRPPDATTLMNQRSIVQQIVLCVCALQRHHCNDGAGRAAHSMLPIRVFNILQTKNMYIIKTGFGPAASLFTALTVYMLCALPVANKKPNCISEKCSNAEHKISKRNLCLFASNALIRLLVNIGRFRWQPKRS